MGHIFNMQIKFTNRDILVNFQTVLWKTKIYCSVHFNFGVVCGCIKCKKLLRCQTSSHITNTFLYLNIMYICFIPGLIKAFGKSQYSYPLWFHCVFNRYIDWTTLLLNFFYNVKIWSCLQCCWRFRYSGCSTVSVGK